MDSFWNVLNVSMICGVVIGSLLATLSLGGILLIQRGRRKVNMVSCIITAVLASFLSLHISFFIGEKKLYEMINEPLEIADTGVRYVSKGITILNSIIKVANAIGMNIHEIPETDPDSINKIKEELEDHQNYHLIYIDVGVIIASILLYFTMDCTEGSKSNNENEPKITYIYG